MPIIEAKYKNIDIRKRILALESRALACEDIFYIKAWQIKHNTALFNPISNRYNLTTLLSAFADINHAPLDLAQEIIANERRSASQFDQECYPAIALRIAGVLNQGFDLAEQYFLDFLFSERIFAKYVVIEPKNINDMNSMIINAQEYSATLVDNGKLAKADYSAFIEIINKAAGRAGFYKSGEQIIHYQEDGGAIFIDNLGAVLSEEFLYKTLEDFIVTTNLAAGFYPILLWSKSEILSNMRFVDEWLYYSSAKQ